MKILFVLFVLFFFFSVNNFANARDFELTVHFNLSASEKHGFIRCRPGGYKLKTEYHLIVIKNEPKYTILRNLELNKDVLGDVEGIGYCNEGTFILKKSINTTEEFIDLNVFLVESYLIKDSIFEVAKLKLPSAENYSVQSKFIDEAGHTIVKTVNTKEITNPEIADTALINSDLIYRIEINRLHFSSR